MSVTDYTVRPADRRSISAFIEQNHYADAEYGHTGTIYRASNFTLEGKRAGARVILFNGKRYHDKAIRTKYKGELKPFAARIKAALETGEAGYATTAGKFCYTYRLRK